MSRRPISERTSFYPSRYRVCFDSAAGKMFYDLHSEAEARRHAKANHGYVLAIWEAVPADGGRGYIQSEVLR